MTNDVHQDTKEWLADQEIKEMFVEFLRAISANDSSYRAEKVAYLFWNSLSKLGDVEAERRDQVAVSAISSAIELARGADEESAPRRTERFEDVDYAKNGMINACAKVFAERISGVSVQLTRAESNVMRNYIELKEAQQRNRRF